MTNSSGDKVVPESRKDGGGDAAELAEREARTLGPEGMTLALVHDWCPSFRGGERVLAELCRMQEGAEVFTLFDFLSPEVKEEYFPGVAFHTSIANRLPRISLAVISACKSPDTKSGTRTFLRMMDAWVSRHVSEAIKCRKRQRKQDRCLQTEFSQLKALDVGMACVLCWTLGQLAS